MTENERYLEIVDEQTAYDISEAVQELEGVTVSHQETGLMHNFEGIKFEAELYCGEDYESPVEVLYEGTGIELTSADQEALEFVEQRLDGNLELETN